MPRQLCWPAFAIVFALGVLAGCEQHDAELSDDLELDSPPVAAAPGDVAPADDADTGIQQVAAESEPPRTGKLQFTLRPGERFPLQKTVEQTLVQQSPTGPLVSRSKLTMMFAITVEREERGQRLLGVRYQRIRYFHDLLGDRVDYDSQQPSQSVPDAAQLYHGMVNNGFSFWLMPDNRVREVVGFDDFLKRCVAHVPAHKQQALLTQVVANQEDEGFANFVDDSIGLLHYKADSPGRETEFKVGEEWNRTRQVMRPLPMALNTTYTLAELTDDLARIDVFGTIVPVKAAALGPVTQAAAGTLLELKDGHSSGECTIDRATGLPIRSRIERHLSLRVRMANQTAFDQHKQIVTTVEAFPSTRTIHTGATDTTQSADGPIVPVKGAAGTAGHGVQPANFVADPF